MRVLIVKESDLVGIDNELYRVDCSGLPADFHALMWEHGKGVIERIDGAVPRTVPAPNLGVYQPYIDAWNRAKKRAQQHRAAHEAWAASTRPPPEAELQGQFDFITPGDMISEKVR